MDARPDTVPASEEIMHDDQEEQDEQEELQDEEE